MVGVTVAHSAPAGGGVGPDAALDPGAEAEPEDVALEVAARRRRAFGIALVAVTLAVAAGGAVLRVATARELRRTEAALADARRVLASVRDDEAQARADLLDARTDLLALELQLGELRASVAATQAVLGERTAERDGVRTAVDATSRELVGVRDTLTAAEQRVFLQTTRIGSLERCLGGVAKALTQATSYDPSAASATLAAVADSCAVAEESVAASLRAVGR